MEITNAARQAMENPTEAPQVQPTAEEEGGASPRPLAQIIKDLQKPIPQRLLKTKRIQGQEIVYCPWYRVQKILDHYTGGLWEYEVTERTITGTHILLTVRLYVYAAEGVFHREGTGIENLSVESFGDPQSNAESMAFRRAAAKWGLGLDLYEKDE